MGSRWRGKYILNTVNHERSDFSVGFGDIVVDEDWALNSDVREVVFVVTCLCKVIVPEGVRGIRRTVVDVVLRHD